MHSELFEFYTPTKDRLSKPMPEWIFHTERGSEGEPRRTGGGERGRKTKKKKQEAEREKERQREEEEERARETQ